MSAYKRHSRLHPTLGHKSFKTINNFGDFQPLPPAIVDTDNENENYFRYILFNYRLCLKLHNNL